MTAKANTVWAALRALYEGEQVSFALLAEASRLTEIRVACRARREGWTDGGLVAVGRKQSARLQNQIERLEAQIEGVIGSGDEPAVGIDKAKLDVLALLLRAIEKLKDMMPSEPVQKEAKVKERDASVRKTLTRIDNRILELAQHFAAKMAKAHPAG